MGGSRWLLVASRALSMVQWWHQAVYEESDSKGRYQFNGILITFVESLLLGEMVPENNVIWRVHLSLRHPSSSASCQATIPVRKENFFSRPFLKFPGVEWRAQAWNLDRMSIHNKRIWTLESYQRRFNLGQLLTQVSVSSSVKWEW